MKTTEGTPLKDLLQREPGVTGTFLVRHAERNSLMSTTGSYTHRGGGKARCRSYPIVTDGAEDVWHVVFITVEVTNGKQKAHQMFKRETK